MNFNCICVAMKHVVNMFLTLEDGFWNVNPKYKHIYIFNDLNKADILHLWFLFIIYGLWLFYLNTDFIPIIIFSSI